MEFWFFKMFIVLFIPIIMIVVGKFFMKNPPKNINIVFGYRTSMSMKNKETWDFAHKYCGEIWIKFGLILLPLSFLSLIFAFVEDIDTVGIIGGIVCCIQIIPLILSVVYTENALKKNFDENGKRKDK